MLAVAGIGCASAPPGPLDSSHVRVAADGSSHLLPTRPDEADLPVAHLLGDARAMDHCMRELARGPLPEPVALRFAVFVDDKGAVREASILRASDVPGFDATVAECLVAVARLEPVMGRSGNTGAWQRLDWRGPAEPVPAR